MVNTSGGRGHALDDLTASRMKDECFHPPGLSHLRKLNQRDVASLPLYITEAKHLLHIQDVSVSANLNSQNQSAATSINTKILWVFRQLFK